MLHTKLVMFDIIHFFHFILNGFGILDCLITAVGTNCLSCYSQHLIDENIYILTLAKSNLTVLQLMRRTFISNELIMITIYTYTATTLAQQTNSNIQ